MSNDVPSLATLYRQLDENSTIIYGTIRIESLKTYLLKRNLLLHIFVSEDQTAIVIRVQYDPKTNKMIGFAPPLSNKTGLLDIIKFVVKCVQDIEDAFKNEEICGNVLVVMAQPFAEGHPAFSLLLFGSNNKFKGKDVLRRFLKGMKINSQLPSTFESKYSPYFQMRFDLDKPVYIQDTVHICTKLKTKLTNPNVTMIMGNCNVSIVHLQNLIAEIMKDKHLLCNSDLDNADKMNFRAIDKISSNEVIKLFHDIPESNAII
ncbi:hypothetical protein FQA39_LY02464 [Lamprigera yunnana]|nr:hypothetical protein FQA39_LY02464 [Lamprigera yunnana]